MNTIKGELYYYPDSGVFERVGGRHHGKPAGTLRSDGYMRIRYKGGRYYSHVLAWFFMTSTWPKADIDHINGDRADNKWENLRSASRAENAANCKLYSSNTSGFKGVSVRDDGRWMSGIRIEGKSVYLGLFDTKEEAYAVYCLAAQKAFGDFARFT